MLIKHKAADIMVYDPGGRRREWTIGMKVALVFNGSATAKFRWILWTRCLRPEEAMVSHMSMLEGQNVTMGSMVACLTLKIRGDLFADHFGTSFCEYVSRVSRAVVFAFTLS